MGTANRKPPFAVPTIFVVTVGPRNLLEQPIGIPFSVPTILVGTPCGSFIRVRKGDIPNEKIRLPLLEVHFGIGDCGRTDSAAGAGQE